MNFDICVETKGGIMKILVSLMALIMSGTVMAETEQIPYDVVLKDRNMEIREYSSYITATVSYKTKSEMRSQGFNTLFRYISGNNIAMTAPVLRSEQIDMTAPVIMGEENGVFSMSFVLPAKYTMETAPKPNDKSVVLKKVEPKLKAAITYSGYNNDRKFESNKESLLFWIKNDTQYRPSGVALRAGYDSPRVMPWKRRNEVLIEVQ